MFLAEYNKKDSIRSLFCFKYKSRISSKSMVYAFHTLIPKALLLQGKIIF